MTQKQKNIAVIGSGFSGLACASFLAREGHTVTVFEKNSQIGGRARVLREKGYVFDMGPSWYWMPEVFERYFGQFNKKPSDYYLLTQLDPAFTMKFSEKEEFLIPASVREIYELFDREEENGAEKLKKFMKEAETKYELSFKNFIYKPSLSILEFSKPKYFQQAIKLDLFNTFHKHIRKFFKSKRLIQLMEFPILFLGGSPKNIPGLYSLMNFSALHQGTWYPNGGFTKIVYGMQSLATELGVEFRVEEPVHKIQVSNRKATAIHTSKGEYSFDVVVCSSDYAHSETLLDEAYRNYSPKYWDKKVFSPSCLIFYLGVNKTINSFQHHNLYFDESLDLHSDEIYKHPKWPGKPLFYVCCPSKTDPGVAPKGHENLFVLMPLAAGLEDTEELRERYFGLLMERLEKLTGEEIRSHIDYKKSYCLNDFKADYNSFKGNAYGLANTLSQTAFLKPSLVNKKVKNLFYTGQLTVPGPGVPPALISGEIVSKQIKKYLNKYESKI